jgi:hypothetical protein
MPANSTRAKRSPLGPSLKPITTPVRVKGAPVGP